MISRQQRAATPQRTIILHSEETINLFEELVPHTGEPHNAGRCTRCQVKKQLEASIKQARTGLENALAHAIRANDKQTLQKVVTDLTWADVHLVDKGGYTTDRRLAQVSQERIDKILAATPLTEEEEKAAQEKSQQPQDIEHIDSSLLYHGNSAIDADYAAKRYAEAYQRAVQQQYSNS